MQNGKDGHHDEQGFDLQHHAPQAHHPTVVPLRGGAKPLKLNEAVAEYLKLPHGTAEQGPEAQGVTIAVRTLFDATINKKNGGNRKGLAVIEYSQPAAEDRITQLRDEAQRKFMTALAAGEIDPQRSVAGYALNKLFWQIGSWNRWLLSKTGRTQYPGLDDQRGRFRYDFIEPREEARETAHRETELGIGELTRRDLRAFAHLVKQLSNRELIQLWLFLARSGFPELGYAVVRNFVRRRSATSALATIEICFEHELTSYASALCDEFLLELVREHRPEQRFVRMIRLAECGGLYGAQLIYTRYGYYDRKYFGTECYDRHLAASGITDREGTLDRKGNVRRFHPHVRAMNVKLRKLLERILIDDHLRTLYGTDAFRRLERFLKTEDPSVLTLEVWLLLDDARFQAKTGGIALGFVRALLEGTKLSRLLADPTALALLPAQAKPLDPVQLLEIRDRLMAVLRDLGNEQEHNDEGDTE